MQQDYKWKQMYQTGTTADIKGHYILAYTNPKVNSHWSNPNKRKDKETISSYQ